MNHALKLTFRICGLLLALICFTSATQEISRPYLRLMFYNVENLFDTKDDSLTNDNEFLPSGQMHWGGKRYSNKINALYKVITAAGEWEPPAIIGLCEIENKSVLHDLIYNTWLSRYKYSVIAAESKDPRGIRTGILYRKDKVVLKNVCSIVPKQRDGESIKTREILYTKWLAGSDTIHLFLNHWPSRRRGVMAEEISRRAISSQLEKFIDSINEKSHIPVKIIIAGDFNCLPDDPELENLCKKGTSLNKEQFFVNLAAAPAAKGEGTFRYRGKWEMLDQVMVSGTLMTSKSGIAVTGNSFRIFRPPFLLEKDPSFPGDTPFPTYRGLKYLGGFSDHLPVILDLSWK